LVSAVSAAPSSYSSGITKHGIMAFARSASLEISPRQEDLLPVLANKLPPGTTLYVAHTPKATLDDVVRVASKAQALGFRASPHIVARRLLSERDLRAALQELKDASVKQVLLVAGDRERPLGKFADSLDLLESRVLSQSGLTSIGVTGYPEGHPAIGPSELMRALERKQVLARRSGLKLHIVSQFCFNAAAVCAWHAHLQTSGITLPVHVGIAGPTPLSKLIRFAVQCGIGASLGSMVKNMNTLGNLVRKTIRPDEMLVGVVRGGATEGPNPVVRPHLFALGGVMATATWLQAMTDGRFELLESGNLEMKG
jgi:methylenetetrahydrofolate reductase (NADPH)